jgi:hypothetical protein
MFKVKGRLRSGPEEVACEHRGMVKVLIHVRAICVLLLLAALGHPARAEDAVDNPMNARLSAEKVGDVEAGIYSAGDKANFTLAPYGDRYLLRFADSPESYVLTVERVILGGRILRYDTGVIAIRVSVWGGMTLYTTDTPGGLPATKIGEETAPPRPAVSHDDLADAMTDEESHLAYTRQLHLRFAADPAVLNGDDDSRRLAFDALVSAEAGVERLIASPGGREALTRRFDTVQLVPSDKPGINMSGKTLLVSFATAAGVAGHPSSREVALQLGKILQIAEAG